MRRRLQIIIVLLGGLLSGWFGTAAAQLQGQTIRIAIGAPLTGGAASFGIEMKRQGPGRRHKPLRGPDGPRGGGPCEQ